MSLSPPPGCPAHSDAVTHDGQDAGTHTGRHALPAAGPAGETRPETQAGSHPESYPETYIGSDSGWQPESRPETDAGAHSRVFAETRTTNLVRLSRVTGAAEPREVYRELRAEWGSVARVELEPGVNAWLVMGYRELLTVSRQEQLYSRSALSWSDLTNGVVAPESGLLPMMDWRPAVIGTDGPEHRRMRKPIEDGITRIDQRRVRREVETLCTELIARFSERGHADLATEYATIVPMLSLGSLFGLRREEAQELLEALILLFGSGAGSQAAGLRFEEIVCLAVREKQRRPTDDMTTVFMNHPNLHTERERVQSVVVTICAGYETVTSWISHTLRLMLTDPRFASRLRGGRLGVDDALDEALWREPPVHNMPARYALHDTELGGRSIKRGDALILGLAAANDDPAIRPEDGEERWGNRAHLAFSAGPHVCPGQVPARLITRTAVNTALHLLPDMTLSIPADEVTWRPSPWTRVPASLPAEFSAARIPARGAW